MHDLKKTERMFSAMKDSCFESDEIDYMLNETDFYYTTMMGAYMPVLPRREKVAYKPVVHKAMRFKKNNVR